MTWDSFVQRATASIVAAEPLAPVAARPLDMPCDMCGAEAEWGWARTTTGGDGTTYSDVTCRTCEEGLS